MIDSLLLICLYGPESTGKTRMARRLAEVYHTEHVPEVARESLVSNTFSIEDIIRIGYAQTERILEKAKTANKILFCDTDLITTQIYSLHYLKTVPPVLFELERRIKFDLYFLFDIDVPWVADGLRDLGNLRHELYAIFRDELLKREIPFVNVQGDFGVREQIVRREIDKLFV
jgi:HTH-type transcriptional repressor of NAD biosynthesis genes